MRTRPPATSAANSPDDVEAAFYEALQRGDIEALMAVWADDDEIVCVHPGGGRVIGAAAIRASFEAIFANGGIPVQMDEVHRLHTINSALHHLVEKISVAGPEGAQTALVLTTNVYLKTPEGWRLAAHHASPGTLQQASAGPAPSAPPRGDGNHTLH
jgi:uncharacterized protein (TIGR02246 family)